MEVFPAFLLDILLFVGSSSLFSHPIIGRASFQLNSAGMVNFPRKIRRHAKNKFLSLLKKLTRPELDGYHKYLKRTHPRDKIALRVFEYLTRFYPDFDQPEQLRIEYAYQKIFKADFAKDDHAHKNMQNTASELYKWLRDFLIESKTQQNQLVQQTIWLGILQERGMKEEFSRKAAEFYQKTREAPFKTPADAFPNWIASYYHREHLSWDKPLLQANIIQQCTDTMTDCWEIIRLKMACEMSAVNKVPNQTFLHQVKEPTDFQQVGLSILKDVYSALLALTDSGEEVHFVRLEYLLNQHGQHLGAKDVEAIIRYAQNFTADQSRHNQEAIHYERLHRLNKIGLAYGVFLQNDHLPSSAFGNIVTVACLTKDFAWAAAFIQDYSHVVFENHRPAAIRLAQSVLAFETGKFREVVSLLESINFEAHLDIMRSKSLLLRSYYELQADQDLLLETFDYLESLLRRSSPKTKADNALLAFVLILRLLVVQKSSKKVILERIEKAPVLYCKTWLLEKTVHYKARFSDRNL